MKLHPSVIEAANVAVLHRPGERETPRYVHPREESNEARARRGLLAQAHPKAISVEMIEAAIAEQLRTGRGLYEGMRAAISAALTYAAKEGES
jgi:hypothetical protein